MIPALCICALVGQSVGLTSQPHMVTFPDGVKRSPLVTPNTEAVSLYQDTLKRLKKEGLVIQAPRAYPTLFKTKINPKSKYQIQIPATGEFKLWVKEGAGFSVVDKDATDGSSQHHPAKRHLQNRHPSARGHIPKRPHRNQ